MEKPRSMSVKEFLVRKLSTEINISERIIMAVVTHQFDGMVEAMHTNNSVELSGFCKFTFNQTVALKRLVKLRSLLKHYLKTKEQLEAKGDDENASKLKNLNKRIGSATADIEYLERKLSKNEKNTTNN